MLLWSKLAHECANRCCTSANLGPSLEASFHWQVNLDLERVEVRVEEEGWSFMTITLPAFGKAFEECLEEGCVTPSSFPGFAKYNPSGIKGWCELPKFLGGFMELIFNTSDGSLRPNASIDAIRSIRQLTLMFGKILLECSDARKAAATNDYLACEQDLDRLLNRITEDDMSRFTRVSELVFGQLFSDVDLLVWEREAVRPHMVQVLQSIDCVETQSSTNVSGPLVCKSSSLGRNF